jgi:hypothetical protein
MASIRSPNERLQGTRQKRRAPEAEPLGIQLSRLYSSKRPSAAAKRQIRRRCKDETQDRT